MYHMRCIYVYAYVEHCHVSDPSLFFIVSTKDPKAFRARPERPIGVSQSINRHRGHPNAYENRDVINTTTTRAALQEFQP